MGKLTAAKAAAKGMNAGIESFGSSVPEAGEAVVKAVVKAVKNKQPKVAKKVAEAVEKVAPKLLKAERSQKKILEFNIKAVKDLNPNLTGDALDEKSLAMFNRSMNAKSRPLLNIKEFKALKIKYEL